MRSLLGAFLVLWAVPAAAVETYAVDPAASEVRFDARATQSDVEGRAGPASGWISVDRDSIAGTARAEIQVEGRGITTRNSNPTGIVNRFFMSLPRSLETDRHPTLSFRLQSLQHVRPSDDGFEAVAVGLLRLRGVWRPVTSIVRVRFEGDRVEVEGEFPVLMSSFGIRPPRLMLGMLRMNDEVTVKYRIVGRTETD